MGRRKAKRYAFYQEMTEPMLPSITAPIPRYLLPRESASRRAGRGIRRFFAAILSFINGLLALAVVLVLLLLFARFLVFCAHLTFPYESWLFAFSTPLVAPFEPYLPSIDVAHYTLDLPTLATMLACLLAVLIVRKFLKAITPKR